MLPEVAKSRLKPCVDIAHSELLILRLNNGLKEQRTKNKESVWHWGNDGSTITHTKSRKLKNLRRVGCGGRVESKIRKGFHPLVHTSAQNHRI